MYRKMDILGKNSFMLNYKVKILLPGKYLFLWSNFDIINVLQIILFYEKVSFFYCDIAHGGIFGWVFGDKEC